MKSKWIRWMLSVPLAVALFATPVLAQPVAAPANEPKLDHPVIPTDASGWAGSMLIIVAAMFVMAAMIGPIVRAEMPVESPAAHDDHAHDAHGHDDHGHGH